MRIRIKDVKKDSLALSIILGALLMIFGLPVLAALTNIIEPWHERFLMIGFMSFFAIYFALLILLVTIKGIFRKIDPKRKKGVLENVSDIKIKIFVGIMTSFIFIVIFLNGVAFLPYLSKGYTYIYVENKEPITKTITVEDIGSQGVYSKFISQRAYVKGEEDPYIYIFNPKRFAVGESYKIQILPDTKYVLDRRP